MNLEIENYKINHTFDRDKKIEWWGEGEWVNEPDIIQFSYRNIDCTIVRKAIPENSGSIFGGYLCGYCVLPNANKYEEKQIGDFHIDVHFGISFSEKTDTGWVIGFDCAHSADIVPSMKNIMKEINDNLIKKFGDFPLFHRQYRNIAFCIEECKKVVNQVLEN